MLLRGTGKDCDLIVVNGYVRSPPKFAADQQLEERKAIWEPAPAATPSHANKTADRTSEITDRCGRFTTKQIIDPLRTKGRSNELAISVTTYKMVSVIVRLRRVINRNSATNLSLPTTSASIAGCGRAHPYHLGLQSGNAYCTTTTMSKYNLNGEVMTGKNGRTGR